MSTQSILSVDSNGMCIFLWDHIPEFYCLSPFLLFSVPDFSTPLTLPFFLSLPIVCHAFMARTKRLEI